ncbi:MAG: baseplate J/gp47 family protein [Chitinophagales bacterium]
MAEREVIAVEADEQINGLIRRLRQSGARQVTFVVPEAAAVLRNAVNLRLLRFYAEQEQKVVRLVTGDAVVQRLADEAGLEWSAAPEASQARGPAEGCYEAGAQRLSEGAATGEGGPRPAPATPRPRLVPSWRHLVWLPVLVLLLAAWQLVAGPAVVVTVEPAVQEVARDVVLRAETGGGGTLPLARLEQAIEATASVETTGHRRVGVAAAHGSVTFLNQNPKPVTIPAGTVLLTTAGLSFRTVETVKVPGVSTDYYMKIPVGVRSGQAEARVVAVEPGAEGNVGAGRLTRFKEGPPAGVQVTNPEPTRGGEDRTAALVTAADLDRVRRAAEAALVAQARPALEALLTQGHELIPDSVRVSGVAVETSGTVSSEAETVSATAQGVASGLEYEPAAARRAAVAALPKLVPAKYTVVPGSIAAGGPRFARVEAGLAEIVVPVTGRLVPALDVAAIRQAARGKTRGEAEAALRRVPGVGRVSITGGGRRLPGWSGRLKVKIAAPAGSV